MPLEVICIVGVGNSGKTTAIRAFLEKKTRLQKKKNKGDVLAIVEAKHKRRYLALGIASLGDAPRQIRNNFAFLGPYSGLDAIVCAARSKGLTQREVYLNAQRLKANVSIITTTKVHSAAQQKKEASRIVREITKLLP